MRPNPQLTPRSVGLGDDFTDHFQGDPLFAQAWGQIYGQMQADGTAQLADFQSRVSEAQTAFTNAYTQIVDNDLSKSPQDIVNAARDLVLVGKTIGGAVSAIEGLISIGGQVDPSKVANTFVGTMIGIGTLVGGLSAGVGAAIIGGFGAVVGFLDSLSTPATAGPMVQICAASQYGTDVYQYTEAGTNRPMKFTVGCVGVYPLSPTPPSPGSFGWRRFPDPNNPADAAWFQIGQLAIPGDTSRTNGFEWQDAFWNLGYSRSYNTAWYPANTNLRPIDAAFPEYRYLECELSQSAISDFQRAFFTAWKANREYALNGLQPQRDAAVLVHVLNLWNASHLPGPQKSWLTQNGVSLFQGGCPGNLTPYLESLVSESRGLKDAPWDPAIGGLNYNDGPIRTARLAVVVIGPPATKSSTGAKVVTTVAVAAGATLAGSALYAWLAKKSLGSVLDRLWDETGGRVFKR